MSFPNESLFVAKSVLGPHGANPPHIHMHMEKNRSIFENKDFHHTRVELGVDGLHKAAGHLQNTPQGHASRLLLPALNPPCMHISYACHLGALSKQ